MVVQFSMLGVARSDCPAGVAPRGNRYNRRRRSLFYMVKGRLEHGLNHG
jgi:hypothetical protein